MSKSFTCERCGDTWDFDPRLIVACPDCKAKVGVTCVRPSEHRTSMPHKARRQLAFEQMPCSCLENWESTHQPELELTT